jgi:molybdate transport system ATP-binding protein
VLEAEFHLDRELVVLFGQSGCGKSSILNAIAGLLLPQRGRISLDGTPLFDSDRALNLPPHRRPLGYVFQHAALFPHLNVADNIGFALNHCSRRQRQLRVGELAEQLHIQDLLDRRVRHLSGGQAQRVAIARALAPQPKALLLDEPFSALDDSLRYDLRRHLKRLQQDLQLPILLVTHSRGEAIELADRLIAIERGRITHIDTPERLLVERSRPVSSRFAWG